MNAEIETTIAMSNTIPKEVLDSLNARSATANKFDKTVNKPNNFVFYHLSAFWR